MDPDRWQRVKALFEQVLAQPPERREAWIAEACGDDAVLAGEVTSLLASHRSDEFLEVPAAALEAQAAQSASPLVGRRVGPYEVTGTVGRGGMGVVYLARDTRLNRLVAIKALAPEFTRDAHQRARLTREARAAAALSHPGIATVYALEQFDDDVFIVGEYVRGETLREALARGPLPVPQLVETAVAVARALTAAHQQGVVHRDLKPENLIRSTDGQVKILDFGLARVREPDVDGATGTKLTAAGAILGTPAYMSPEQLRGDAVDFRSDLFAFGATFYEMASGQHPFAGDDPIATISRILSGEAPAPLTALTPAPPALARIIDRCLRRSPDERYAATADLVADLECLQRTLAPLRAPATAGSYTFERGEPGDRAQSIFWWQVHQIVAGLAPCLLLVPLWRVQGWTPDARGLALFVAATTAAVTLATLRSHLWFTSRVYPSELGAQRARTRPWLVIADFVFLLLLLSGAALVAAEHRAFAALLAGAGVALALASTIIEPTTTRAAFGPRSDA